MKHEFITFEFKTNRANFLFKEKKKIKTLNQNHVALIKNSVQLLDHHNNTNTFTQNWKVDEGGVRKDCGCRWSLKQSKKTITR